MTDFNSTYVNISTLKNGGLIFPYNSSFSFDSSTFINISASIYGGISYEELGKEDHIYAFKQVLFKNV